MGQGGPNPNVEPLGRGSPGHHDRAASFSRKLSGKTEGSASSSGNLASPYRLVNTPPARAVDKPRTLGAITAYDANIAHLPKEALSCHACKKISFRNNGEFKDHVKSPHHVNMFKLLETRNGALLQFLRAGSAIVSEALQKEVLDNRKNMSRKKPSDCTECSYCNYSMLSPCLAMHYQCSQHKEIVEFVKPLCCGIKFSNRETYETHKITFKHLDNKYKLEEKFIVDFILTMEREAQLSAKRKPSTGKRSSSSLTLDNSEYIIEILKNLERDPLVLDYDDKEYFCLACEVTISKFKKTSHTSSMDHHEKINIFCSKNKVRHCVKNYSIF